MAASSATDGARAMPSRSSSAPASSSSSTRAPPAAGAGGCAVTSLGARRASAAAMASAQASGVRKFGTPARLSAASASGASGARNAASGLPAPALSMIGRTVFSGCARADEPTTASTRSNSGADSKMSSAVFIVAYCAPATVRSTMRAGLTSMPAAASRASVAALAGSMVDAAAARADRPPWWRRPPSSSPRRRSCAAGPAPRAARGRAAAGPRSGRRAYRPGRCRIGEKHVGDVVLARQRAGMRDRKLARRRRAAELVGQDRLAARAPLPARSAARQRRAAWSRETACSRRCRDRRASPRRCRPSERSTSLPTETSPAKPMPRALPRVSSAPIMLPL